MVEIRDKESLEAWLKTQPREVAMLIAGRAALRVLPLLVGIPRVAFIHGEQRERAPMLVPLLFSGTMPFFAHQLSSMYLYKIDRIVATIYVISDNIGIFFVKDSDIHAASTHLAASHVAESFARCVSFICHINASEEVISNIFNASILESALEAMKYFNVIRSESLIWRSVTRDAHLIETAGVTMLRTTPLWQRADWPKRKDLLTPRWATDAWTKFKAELLAENMDFDVWTRWYDDRLVGAPVDDNEQRVRAGMEPEWFDEGPAAYNAELKRRLREAGKWVDDEVGDAEPPAPELRPGVTLQPTPAGFDIVASPPTEDERHDPQLKALHDNLLRRIQRLDLVVPRLDNTHRLLADEYRDFASFVSNELADINVASVWSTGAALTEMVDRFEQLRAAVLQRGDKTAALDLPDEQIMAQFVQLSRDFSAFILGFAEGRDLLARVRAMKDQPTAPTEVTKNVLERMFVAPALLAERAKGVVRSILRSLDDAPVRTSIVATDVASNALVSLGRVARSSWPYVFGVGAVAAVVDVGHKLTGDPNWETTHAAAKYLMDNRHALSAFANHDPVLRRWLEWLLREIDAAVAKAAKKDVT